MNASSIKARLTTTQRRVSIAGVAAIGAAAITFSLVPDNKAAVAEPQAAAAPLASVDSSNTLQAKTLQAGLTTQESTSEKMVRAATAKAAKAEQAPAVKVQALATAPVKPQSAAKAEAAVAKRATVEQPASRTAARKPVYADNLDGWIRESLDIMQAQGIPGTYHGIHRNVMRESSGNPYAVNNWDVNAANGIPSKGLLQVIPPTFNAYHVPGTSWNIYDPVANITAACNYAADRYGTIDNVNSAY
ncbi:hypothetical protein GCM10020367_13320 [Streptomyces sannanensis]|uniref:Transglycosylase SLT domain-containing protein n=1 Tax=Streptomyces sannanensis TaxID=285536 RepID=A0ABP6S6W6_9ACTN